MTDLSPLVKLINREGGFQLLAHAVGRPDLNDGNYGDGSGYIRAAHKIPQEKSYTPIEYQVQGIVLRIAEKCKDSELVVYGQLTKSVTEKTRGFLGMGKKDVSVRKRRRLSDILDTTNNDDAYYMRLSVNAVVIDGVGRSATEVHPSLTIIADKDLIIKTISYLRENPTDYQAFVKRILPNKKYPRVNAGILDRIEPTENLVLFDLDTASDDPNFDASYLLRRYGERIK